MFARTLSAIKSERTRASKVIVGPEKEVFRGDKKQFVDDLEQALYASKIISYTQGFMLMRETAKELGWHLNYASIARIWRGGCIIKVRAGKHLRLADLTCLLRCSPFSSVILHPHTRGTRTLSLCYLITSSTRVNFKGTYFS